MNRMTREYCLKGQHPRWRAWRAKYDMSKIEWPWLGEYCTNCGALCTDTVGSGPPTQKSDKLRRLHERVLALRQKLPTCWYKLKPSLV